MAGKSYDPQMHTAEHILNQTMNQQFGCGRSFNAHIEKKKSKCDYHFSRPLTKEEVQKIEESVNQIIQKDLPVTEKMVLLNDAHKLYDTKKLPKGVAEKVRIVFIGDYDRCPCIGPHVSSTSEIGHFSIISHDYQEGRLRLRFKLQP